MAGRRGDTVTTSSRAQCASHAVTRGRQCSRKARPGEVHCGTHLPASTALAPYGSDRRTPAHAVTASTAAVNLEGVGWQTYRFGSRAWQAEAWRLYDITGQLRFVSGWQANSVSRCRLYVAQVDDSGEAGDEVEDEEIAGLAAVPLGQGPAKDEALRLAALGLFVPGETYMIVEADAGDDGEDRWMVVSGRQIARTGDQITIRRPLMHGGGDMLYRPGVDLIIRCWTPHPADPDEPDSPTRSALSDLRELEAIKKREFAELDSRLTGAGVLLLPQGIDFPKGPDDPPGVQGFGNALQSTMAMSLRDRSSAAATVPIVATVPPETVDKIKLLTFWSELSDALLPMRASAITSLAQSLDVPAEILTGVADVNHWCVDDQTEILTIDGWVGHDQLKAGALALTLDTDRDAPEWQPVEAVHRWTVEDEKMLSIEGDGHSSLTTLGHRWPVWDPGEGWTMVTSADLSSRSMLDGPDGIVDLGASRLTYTTYTGTIWCPTTGNGTWLARRNGKAFYTGNSAWQMSDDAIRTQIVPVLSRIADALTTGYLRGALEVMGLDPDAYMYAFDVSPLTVKPNRAADGLSYYQAGIISESAAVEVGAFREDQTPDDAERLRRMAERLLMASPALAVSYPVLLELVGIEAPPPALPPAGEESEEGEDQEEEPEGEGGDEGPPETESDAEQADGDASSTTAIVAVCSLAMVRALSLAGGRLVPHTQRDRYAGTPRHELHTRVGAVERAQADHVLRGAWDELAHVAADLDVDTRELGLLLHEAAADLLTRGLPYDPAELRASVTAAVRAGHLTSPLGVAA